MQSPKLCLYSQFFYKTLMLTSISHTGVLNLSVLIKDPFLPFTTAHLPDWHNGIGDQACSVGALKSDWQI